MILAMSLPSVTAHATARPPHRSRAARVGARAASALPALLVVALLGTAACGSENTDTGSGGAVEETANESSGTVDAGSLSTAGPGAGSVGSLNSGSADGIGGSGAAAPQTTGRVDVVRTLPHDPAAFTQGLEFHGDALYESTGEYGTSWVSSRPLDAGATDYTLKTDSLPQAQFGEGMTFVGDSLWQLTWKDGVAYRRDAATGAETGQAHYDGEGWGLCNLGDRLAMSDGSNTITFRDPETFAPTGTIRVTRQGAAVDELNELECSGGKIYANVWLTNTIVRIDPGSGEVDGVWDLGALEQPRPGDPNAVLNGIAAVPGSDTFVVTGKLWPNLYEVRLS